MHHRRTGALASAVIAATALVPSAAAVAPVVGAHPFARLLSTHAFAAPPTTAQCEAAFGIACYDPAQIQTAYDEAPLFKAGDAGQGETIAIVDSFGSPTIASQLATFDAQFGLPAPASLRIIAPAGPIPAFDPSNASMVGWAQETSLDVEYAHTIAPKANLLLVETPVAETEGVTGFPEIVQAENYVVDHHLAQVISQSFGATEETFPNAQSLMALRSAFVNAAQHGVTVLGASGDGGATDSNSATGSTYYTHPVDSWPSSDPLVTSVGGTQLHLDASGQRTQPDTVWNDTNLLGGPAASGGGASEVFSRPSYQTNVVHNMSRTTPDISMSAAVDGGVIVYFSADAAGAGHPAGYYIIGGTSEATPLFSGIVAITAQVAGHGLGAINPALYALDTRATSGIVDVTAGTNTVTFSQGGSVHTVLGHDAVAGYDEATGLGTVDAAAFVPALAAAAGHTAS